MSIKQLQSDIEHTEERQTASETEVKMEENMEFLHLYLQVRSWIDLCIQKTKEYQARGAFLASEIQQPYEKVTRKKYISEKVRGQTPSIRYEMETVHLKRFNTTQKQDILRELKELPNRMTVVHVAHDTCLKYLKLFGKGYRGNVFATDTMPSKEDIDTLKRMLAGVAGIMQETTRPLDPTEAALDAAASSIVSALLVAQDTVPLGDPRLEHITLLITALRNSQERLHKDGDAPALQNLQRVMAKASTFVDGLSDS